MKDLINHMLNLIGGYKTAIHAEANGLEKSSIKGCEAVLLLRDSMQSLNSALDAVRIARNQEEPNAK